ncbi:Cytochrome P450 9e2 [Blattella germanica]|nr:Cytochrome P450 9e2 [Blattella germanica]
MQLAKNETALKPSRCERKDEIGGVPGGLQGHARLLSETQVLELRQRSREESFFLCVPILLIMFLELPFLVLLIVVIVLLRVVGSRNHNFYSKRRIPYVRPALFVGNLWPLLSGRMSQCDFLQWLYEQLNGHRLGGMYGFTTPALMIRDPDLIREVCVRHFEHFTDRRILLTEEVDPVAGKVLPSLSGNYSIVSENRHYSFQKVGHCFKLNRFLCRGDRWRKLRTAISPAFSWSLLRAMHRNVSTCTRHFIDYLQQQSHTLNNCGVQIISGSRPGMLQLEMRDVMSRLFTDVLAEAALGAKSNSFNSNNTLYRACHSMTNFTGSKAIVLLGYLCCPKLMKMMKVRIIDSETMKFFISLVKELEKSNHCDDIFGVLMQARDRGQPGIETITTLLCFSTYLLATHPDSQEKLWEEIKPINLENTSHLQKLQYLEMVIAETLRLFPPVEVIDRKCVRPLSCSDLEFQEGEGLVIPIYAIQRDPEYFPDPERFHPERFSEENRRRIKPFTYLPFGAGPRSCLGEKFGKDIAKLTLVSLLQNYKLVTVPKTCVPLRLAKMSFNKVAEGGFWLGLSPRDTHGV